MQRVKRNHGINALLLNMNVPVTDKNGRELFPDFSITPWTKNLQGESKQEQWNKRPETVHIDNITSKYIDRITNQDLINVKKNQSRK